MQTTVFMLKNSCCCLKRLKRIRKHRMKKSRILHDLFESNAGSDSVKSKRLIYRNVCPVSG